MARIRTVKPEFHTHEGLGSLSPLHRLGFQGLWNYADREGRLRDRPNTLKLQILPWDDVDFDAILCDLAAHDEKFITRYEVGGRRFIQVNSFREHQCPMKSEGPSKIPPPPKDLRPPILRQSPDDTPLIGGSAQHHQEMERGTGNGERELERGKGTGKESASKQQSRDGTGDRPEPTAAAPPCLPAGLPACDLIRGAPWLGELIDPDATLRRIGTSHPRLDIDAVVAEAVGVVSEYGPGDLIRLREQSSPERWLRNFAKNRDEDRHRREVELAEAQARGAAEGARPDDDRPPPVARLPSRGDGNLTASEKTIAASRRVLEKAREKDRRREAEAAEKAAGGGT